VRGGGGGGWVGGVGGGGGGGSEFRCAGAHPPRHSPYVCSPTSADHRQPSTNRGGCGVHTTIYTHAGCPKSGGVGLSWHCWFPTLGTARGATLPPTKKLTQRNSTGDWEGWDDILQCNLVSADRQQALPQCLNLPTRSTCQLACPVRIPAGRLAKQAEALREGDKGRV